MVRNSSLDTLWVLYNILQSEVGVKQAVGEAFSWEDDIPRAEIHFDNRNNELWVPRVSVVSPITGKLGETIGDSVISAPSYDIHRLPIERDQERIVILPLWTANGGEPRTQEAAIDAFVNGTWYMARSASIEWFCGFSPEIIRSKKGLFKTALAISKKGIGIQYNTHSSHIPGYSKDMQEIVLKYDTITTEGNSVEIRSITEENELGTIKNVIVRRNYSNNSVWQRENVRDIAELFDLSKGTRQVTRDTGSEVVFVHSYEQKEENDYVRTFLQEIGKIKKDDVECFLRENKKLSDSKKDPRVTSTKGYELSSSLE